MNDDVLKLYNSLQKYGYGNLGTSEEFGRKVQDSTSRRKLYDSLTRDGFGNLGSFEEFSSRLTATAASSSDQVQQERAASPEQTDAPSQAGTPASRTRTNPRTAAFNERVRQADARHTAAYADRAAAEMEAEEEARRRELADQRAAAEAAAAQAESRRKSDRAHFESNMTEFDRMRDSLNPVSRIEDMPDDVRAAMAEDAARERTREELEAVKARSGSDRELIREYENRRREYEDAVRKRGYVRGDMRGHDFSADTKRLAAEKKWLDDNEYRYDAAKRQVGQVDRALGVMNNEQRGENLERIGEKRRREMELLDEDWRKAVMSGPRGSIPFNPGTAEEREEDLNHAAASSYYGQAEQQWNQGSKYDEGYEGDVADQVWTAISQFVSGAANNIDLGSFTMGLTEGSAAFQARKAGEHYNELINSAMRELGYKDADVQSLLDSVRADNEALRPLVESLNRDKAQIDAMKTTYEDMVRSGDPKAEAYAREYNRKIDEYNRRIKDEYDPVANRAEENAKKYDDLMAAVDAAVSEGLTDGEKAVLDAMDEFTKAKMARMDDVSRASKGGAGAEQSAEFMLDFILTGGIAKAGTKAATKIATRRLLKREGADALRKLAAVGKKVEPGFGLKFATDMVTAGIRTAVMGGRNLQAAGEKLTEYEKDDLGRYAFSKSRSEAAIDTALSQFIEYWSEGFGEYFGAGEQWLFRKATKLSPKTVIGQTLKNYRGSIGKYLDYGKFDGMFNEMLEEVVGSTFNALNGLVSGDRVGDKEALKDFFAWDNLSTLFLSFLPMSTISSATNIRAYNKMRERYDAGVETLTPFIESGAIKREELDELANGLSDLTPEQAREKVDAITDKARASNGGRLPKNFGQAVMGYLEGSLALNYRNEEWENSQEKLAVVNAYTYNYANPNPLDAWDTAQNEKAARAEAEAAGFTEFELNRDSYMLGQQALEMRAEEGNEERADALMNYATAKAASDGLRDGYREEGQKWADSYGQNVRTNLDSNGRVVTANIKIDGQDTPVFVTSKDATVTADGGISTPTGDGVVTYRLSEKGEERTAKAGEFSGAESMATEDYISEVTGNVLQRRQARFEQAERTVSPMGRARAIEQKTGQAVIVRDHRGVYQPVTVERMTDNGQGVVIGGDAKFLQGVATALGMHTPAGKYLEAPSAKLWDLLSKEEDGSLSTEAPEMTEEELAEAEARAAATPEVTAKDTPTIVSDSVNDGAPTMVRVVQVGEDGVDFEYEDALGNLVDGTMSIYDFQQAMQTEQTEAAPFVVPPAEGQAAESSFPVNQETGDKIYDHPSVTPQAALNELLSGVKPGSKDEANRMKYIGSKAAAAVKAVEDAENRLAGLQTRRDAVDNRELPDGEELDAFERRKAEERQKIDEEMAQVAAELPELRRKAAHWNAVRGSAARRYADRVNEERENAVIERAASWTARTGVNVKFFRSPDEVDDARAKKALMNGEQVAGWYNDRTGEVGIYLPYINDEADMDKTFIHEVVSHKGLRELLGDEKYGILCDKVWDQLMTDAEKKKYSEYNEDMDLSEEAARRAAADEWIAALSEKLDVEANRNLFERLVDFVKEFIDNLLSDGTKITRDDLKSLLRSSLARYASAVEGDNVFRDVEATPLSMESLSPETQSELRKKGEVMDGGVVMDERQDELKRETGYKTPNELDMESSPEVGYTHLSKTTMPAWAANYMLYPEAREHVVKVLEELTRRMAADELVDGVTPQGTYKYGEKASGGFAGPLRTNIEYIVTFDMDTSCPRSLQYLEYVKQIEAKIGRPLTQREMIQLTEMMRAYGQMIPCVYCYCENKRQALKQYYTDFINARQAVINAKTDEEALEHMYGHSTKKDARDSKDPAVALNPAAYEVFREWRNGKQTYNPSIRQLWAQYRNDRNVILTVLDDMLDGGRVTTNLTDEVIKNKVCKELGITEKNAKAAVKDIVSEWKWNRIEDRPHDDFTRIEDEDDLVVGVETLKLWREMTSYGKSASSAKNVMRYVPYTDELKTLSQEQKDDINGLGGLRMHSSNDFRIDYVLDYFQFMADMEVNGMFGHTYTKSPEFVRIFGNSGYKINMSIAAYEDSHGIRPNPDEGFDWETARELRRLFPNAGTMLMATSDAQIQMALDSDWIDMFIPFHHSGLPKAVWGDMRMWQDYTSKQNERFLNSAEMREELEKDGVDVPKDASADEVQNLYNDHFNIRVEMYYDKADKKMKRVRPHFLPGKTVINGVDIPGHGNDYQRYIELCRQWGVRPRFYGIRVKDNTPEGGGREVDITEHPAYMKCIKETARTDTPQTAIKFNFDEPSEALGGMSPIDYAMRELEARAAAEMKSAGGPVRNIYESYKQDPYGIVPQFISGVINREEQYRKTHDGAELPLDFLTPDSRRWFMTERRALEEAYKDVDTIPYHPHEYDENGNLIMAPEVKRVVPVVANGGIDTSTMLRKRDKPAPKKTKTGYAAFAVLQGADGKYYLQPKMVQVEGQGTPVLTWLDADTGEIRRDKDGNMITNTRGRIKVQDSSINKRGGSSKGQGLAWRPGKHLAEYPNATQFAVANPETGVKDVMQDNIVFFEVSYAADKDYQTEAWEYGFDEKGNYNHSQAGLPYIPSDGYYKYRTNVNPDIPAMIITGAFKVERALTDAEAKEINQKAGGTWLERESGKPVDEARLREFGFAEDQLEERRDEYDFSAIEGGRDESAEVMKLEGYTPHAIDFDNEALKAAAKENGQDLDSYREGYQSPEERGWDRRTYTGESDTRFRKANQAQLGLVSNAGAALDRIKMEKAMPEQWAKMLEKEGGLKAGEDKWLGLSDWLKSQDKKTLTKDEIADYIAEHKILLAEVQYSADGDAVAKSLEEMYPGFFNAFSIDRNEFAPGYSFVDGILDDRLAIEFYNQYNEDEINPDEPLSVDDYRKVKQFADEIYSEGGIISPMHGTRQHYTTEGLDNKREIAIVLPTVDPYHGSMPEVHFDDKRTGGRAVVWSRFGDTVDENGNRVLVIDEIQSQRHEDARKAGGYETKDRNEELENARAELSAAIMADDAMMQQYLDYTKPMKDRLDAGEITREEFADFLENDSEAVSLDKASEDAHRMRMELQDKVNDLRRISEENNNRPAPAPFEKNWHELAMKRMLRLAAEEGYDYVAWTTGEQQADRYNMRDLVDSISYEGMDHGLKLVDINMRGTLGRIIHLGVNQDGVVEKTYDGDGNETAGEYDGKKLSDIIGKELSDKVLALEEGREVSGGDLEVGGEGMKGFYDEILPRFMNKYGKKWGVKVQDITLPNVEEAGRTMHAVPVTQEMKESVMQGQTMFRKSTVTPEQDAEYMAAVEAGDMKKAGQMVRDAFRAAFPDTKVVDENGEPMVVYHGSPNNFTEFWTTGNDGDLGEGSYFTSDWEVADSYTRRNGDNEWIIDSFIEKWFDEHPGKKISDQAAMTAATKWAEENAFKDATFYAVYLNIENPRYTSMDDFIKVNGGNYVIRESSHDFGKGYDGIIDRTFDERFPEFANEGSIQFVAFRPNQIKSADPVTYDDNGKVIPLSERFNPENNDIRFRKQDSPEYQAESQKIFDMAKEHFGTTTDLREAGYALPDGTMLDFSGRHWADPKSDNSWLRGRRQVDHRDIHELNYEKDGNTPSGIDTGMSDFIQRGAIRLNSDVINLANKPTRGQEDVLWRLIYRADGDVDVDFGDGQSSDHYVSYNHAAPARIIQDIRRYFDEGVKPESNTMFRRAEPTKEDLEKEARISNAEREAAYKTVDEMAKQFGVGVKRAPRNKMPKGHATDKGYYNPVTGVLTICSDNVTDERDEIATVIHETVGRNGLRELFGDEFNKAMVRVYASLDADGRAWVNGYISRNGLKPGDEAVVLGMEQYMAEVAKRDGGGFMDDVNEILGKTVDILFGTEGFQFTDRELDYILRASYEHSKDAGWLDTPAGRAKDTLWRRELGINESDPNKPTDPDGPDAGTRFRRADSGVANADYDEEMNLRSNIAKIELQNADLPVKIGMEKVMKEVGKTELEDNEDYLTRHNIASSRADTEAHDFMLFHFTPMLEKVREIQSRLIGPKASKRARSAAYERILDYIYAVSGLERNEWERNNGGEAKDWSGITSLMGRDKDDWQQAEAEAQAMIDDFRAAVGDDALLDELWSAIQSCTDYSLDHAYKYGLITKEDYERLRGTDTKPRLWNHYVPLRGFAEKTAEDVYDYVNFIGTDPKNNSEVVKDAKGRWTKADNPLANILNIAQREIAQGNENWARQALYRFTLNAGKNSLLSARKPWYVKETGTDNWVLAMPGANESIEDFEERMKAARKTGDAKQRTPGLKINYIMSSEAHQNQHLIRVKFGGEDKMIWVNGNPAFAKAVSGISNTNRSQLGQFIRRGSRVISNLFTTYSLNFTAKNLIRDTIYSRIALNVKEDKKYRKQFKKNWWSNGGFSAAAMVRLARQWDSGELQDKLNPTPKEQMFIDFMHDGGQTGYTVIRSVEVIKKDLEKTMRRAGKNMETTGMKIMNFYPKLVRTLNEGFELLTRFTAYQTSRDMGRSGQRAAEDAKEISVNFNRKGAQSGEGFWGVMASYLGATHYFFNAGVQGFDNFLRLFKVNGKKMSGVGVGFLSAGIAMPAINALLSGGDDDDDWYWNIPEWARRNNIIIGWPKFYIAIPLPVEMRAFYGLGDAIASMLIYQKMPNHTFGRVAMDIISTASAIVPVNPVEGYNGKNVDLKDAVLRSLAPDITMFFVDWITNEDYTGRALVKENKFKNTVPKSQGVYASTPKALVDACQTLGEWWGLDVPPGLVRDFLNNYLGGFYRVAEDMLKLGISDEEHPRRFENIPFFSGFTGHLDEDRSNTFANSVLYEYKDMSEELVTKMNLYNRSDFIDEKMAFEYPETLPSKAKIQKMLDGKRYELAKMYYEGMHDRDTGMTRRVLKIHKSGKSAGKPYWATEKVKEPGVNTLRKQWNDLRKEWLSMDDTDPDKAQKGLEVQDAWHKYWDAAADLAEKLLDYEYGN